MFFPLKRYLIFYDSLLLILSDFILNYVYHLTFHHFFSNMNITRFYINFFCLLKLLYKNAIKSIKCLIEMRFIVVVIIRNKFPRTSTIQIITKKD